MRMLTFSVLKNCKFRTLYRSLSSQPSSDTMPAEMELRKTTGDPSMIQAAPSWPLPEEAELHSAVVGDMQVYPDFVSESEEASLLAELEPYLKRMRYEFDHWDNAIQGYRETEKREWSAENAAIIERVKQIAFVDSTPLPHQHVLDLAAAGHIKPHVDAVRFCGEVIAGICLLSSAVMRLEHCEKKHLVVDALLQRRALYIMRGVARYQFTHAVPCGADSVWRGAPLRKSRRLAVICRSQPAQV